MFSYNKVYKTVYNKDVVIYLCLFKIVLPALNYIYIELYKLILLYIHLLIYILLIQT